MKKNCYLFVFEGFADYEISMAAAGINHSDEYRLKIIGISKDPVRAMSGMTIIPDLDFRPEIDLADIDADNTALLILPGNPGDEIIPLVDHCLLRGIPVASIGSSTVNDFTQHIFDTLGIAPLVPENLHPALL